MRIILFSILFIFNIYNIIRRITSCPRMTAPLADAIRALHASKRLALFCFKTLRPKFLRLRIPNANFFLISWYFQMTRTPKFLQYKTKYYMIETFLNEFIPIQSSVKSSSLHMYVCMYVLYLSFVKVTYYYDYGHYFLFFFTMRKRREKGVIISIRFHFLV